MKEKREYAEYYTVGTQNSLALSQSNSLVIKYRKFFEYNTIKQYFIYLTYKTFLFSNILVLLQEL
jgi:hypothetical protein